ncbi:Hint domain-containing protein [Aliiroseovarius sp. CAU 1755]
MTPISFSGGAVAGYVRSTCPTAGIGPGALVRTLHGNRAIDTLSPGDRILTSDGTRARLASVSRHVAPARKLCRISPNELAAGRARTDPNPVVLSDQQHVMVDGWMARAMFGHDRALVPVSAITDGELIRHMDLDAELPLFQLHFDTPQLVRVGGLNVLATPARQTATETPKHPAF